MAIFPKPRVVIEGGLDEAPGIDIEAWTVEQAAEALQATSIASPPRPRGTTVTIEIPLDEDTAATAAAERSDAPPPRPKEAVHTVYRRREPIRRDSLKRREALLKGKEGSRRRQRWENDRLLSNPYAQPPLPSDWEVRPTYPVQSVPYFLAPLWDAEYKAKAQAKSRSHRSDKSRDLRAHGTKEEQAAARVPRDLREKLKKSRGAKGMLQDLEEEVRRFVEEWSSKGCDSESNSLVDGDSEDEEIVFVGRNGAMSDDQNPDKDDFSSDADALARERMIFQSVVDDHSAAFGRWLVHSIATYYGLDTWSVTTGSPARREAYIGLKSRATPLAQLPRPLWGLV